MFFSRTSATTGEKNLPPPKNMSGYNPFSNLRPKFVKIRSTRASTVGRESDVLLSRK